jgi:hypothetical protein
MVNYSGYGGSIIVSVGVVVMGVPTLVKVIFLGAIE